MLVTSAPLQILRGLPVNFCFGREAPCQRVSGSHNGLHKVLLLFRPLAVDVVRGEVLFQPFDGQTAEDLQRRRSVVRARDPLTGCLSPEAEVSETNKQSGSI
jgi:hypothetical protein